MLDGRLHGWHQATIQQINAEVAAQQQIAAQKLSNSVSPATAAALSDAQASHAEAQAAHDNAVERLAAHDANRPTMLGNVTSWAKQRGALVDELDAYAAILADRQQRLAAAQQQQQRELMAAWSAYTREVQQEAQAAVDAAVAAVGEAQLDVQRAQARVSQAHHRQMIMGNLIDAIRPGR